MADEAQPGNDAETKPAEFAPGLTAKQQEVLRLHAIKPGEKRNKTGMNGWKRAQARITKFMRALDAERGDGKTTRFEHLLQAAYEAALVSDRDGAADRKLLIEQCAGRAKQQVDVTSLGERLTSGVFALPAGPQTAEEWERQHGAGSEVDGDDSDE